MDGYRGVWKGVDGYRLVWTGMGEYGKLWTGMDGLFHRFHPFLIQFHPFPIRFHPDGYGRAMEFWCRLHAARHFVSKICPS